MLNNIEKYCLTNMISFYDQVILLADERKAEGNVSIHTLLKLLVLSPTAPLEKLELLKQLHLIIVSYQAL